jgi:hypothetical protein
MIRGTFQSLHLNHDKDVYVIVQSLTIFTLLILLFIPAMVHAQNNQSVRAYKIDTSIQIDGILDEAAWSEAETVTDFLQYSPYEGAASTQMSEVRILYGEGSIYIGAMLYDDNPDGIEQALGRRDDYNRADWFLVSIDSYFNRQNAYTFGVNAAGIQYDAIRTSGGGGGPGLSGMDTSWDAIWYSEVRVTNEGWIVEMEIPYSMLRFPDTAIQTWGIHFTRRIPRLGEITEWPLVPRVERDNLIAQFGHLVEIRDIEPRPNIQFRPYTLSSLNRSESLSNPGTISSDLTFDAGADFKIGLGPNITLDAAFNPDFGQVESDPAVLNLTAFETFFDEQRPFFVEGIQIYEFSVGPGELLYTRRIGAQSPIIGATKLSGRTEKGLSFGVLGAVSGDNFDPSRNYGVTRLSQQLGDYSSLGGIFTFFDSPYDRGDGRRRSYSGGLDWDVRFADNAYGIEGFTAFTHRTLTAEQDSETGIAAKSWIVKRQGIWSGFAGLDIFSDTFNPNDLGQLRSNNNIVALSRIEHQINESRPFGPVQQADANLFAVQQFSYDERLNLGLELEIESEWTLRSFQSVETAVVIENLFGGYDLFETRGLEPWAKPFKFEVELEYETDERRSWQFSPEARWTYYQDGGREYGLDFRGNLNIGTRLSFSSSFEVEWERDVVAWTANESFMETDTGWMIGSESVPPGRLSPDDFVSFDDNGLLNTIFAQSEPFDNNIYYASVFGARDTRSMDFTLRSTVTFIPNLSLQFYSQFFLARGKYQDFQIHQNRDHLAAFDPYPKRDEFSLNSFQSNAVLRWEYRPGSTIFLVWSHGRLNEDNINPLAPYGPSPYDRSIGRQVSDTFGILPNNTFLIKVNYTFLY